MKRFLIKYWPILTIFVLSLPTLIPFLKPGLFPSHDGPVYVLRSQQFFKALADGQLPPRWAQDFNFGFGYPIFNFFYPLAYNLVSFFHLFGLSFVASVKLLFLLSFISSGITMYFFAREFLGKFGGIISALLYLYSPFHSVDLYVRGSLGELLVMAFLPLLLLWVYKGRFLLAGITLALIILAHNILAMMSFVLLFSFTLYHVLIYDIKKKHFYRLLLTLFLGLGLSCFFWLPALLEKKYTIFDQIALKEFNFRDHFVYLLQLRYSPWGFGGSLPGPIDGMSFKLGKIHLLFALVGVLSTFVLQKRKDVKKITLFFVLIFLGSIFLSLNLSFILWKYLPFLELVQFPWRFLNFTMLGMAFLGGGVGFFVEKFVKKKFFYLALFLTSFLIVFFNFSHFQAGPEAYKVDKDYLSKEKVFATNSTYADELLPVWVKEKPKVLPQNKIEIAGRGEVSEEEFKSNLIKAKINLKEKAQVVINNFYFPGWQAFVDKQKKEIEILEPLGNIGLILEKGEHLLELKLLSTGIQRCANFISLLSLISLAILLCRKKLKF